jgi:hypothetical protein
MESMKVENKRFEDDQLKKAWPVNVNLLVS